MASRYDLVCFDLDGTLCPTGRALSDENLKIVDTTPPEEFKRLDLSGFNFRPFPGVLETLDTLRRSTRLSIISNGFENRQLNKIYLIGLDGYFHPICISEEHAKKMFGVYDDRQLKSIEKPSSSMFQRMNWKTKTSPERCVYIGNIYADYLAARNASWDFIGVIDADEKYKDDFKGEKDLKLVQQYEFQRILEHILEQ